MRIEIYTYKGDEAEVLVDRLAGQDFTSALRQEYPSLRYVQDYRKRGQKSGEIWGSPNAHLYLVRRADKARNT